MLPVLCPSCGARVVPFVRNVEVGFHSSDNLNLAYFFIVLAILHVSNLSVPGPEEVR